jgi:predicted phage terminase large subunit-like protein
MRLHAQTAWFENGLVFLPRHASWLSEYVTELTGFPGSRYDDQVDSTTQALSRLKVPSSLEILRRLGAEP